MHRTAPCCPEGQEANPHRLAGLFLKERLTFSEGIGLRFWRDVFNFWDGSAYRTSSHQRDPRPAFAVAGLRVRPAVQPRAGPVGPRTGRDSLACMGQSTPSTDRGDQPHGGRRPAGDRRTRPERTCLACQLTCYLARDYGDGLRGLAGSNSLKGNRLRRQHAKHVRHDREDTGLFDRLSRELPGILLWALAGWQRLRRRGPVMQPRSCRELLAAMEELEGLISAFLGDRCVLDPREIVPLATLYKVWRSWCQEHGRDAVGDEPSFGPDVNAASPGLSKSRLHQGSLRITHYRGIRLRTPLDPDQEPAGEEPLTTAEAFAEPPI